MESRQVGWLGVSFLGTNISFLKNVLSLLFWADFYSHECLKSCMSSYMWVSFFLFDCKKA